MIKKLNLTVLPEVAFTPERLQSLALHKSGVPADENHTVRITKRSIDARTKRVKVQIQADVFINEPPKNWINYRKEYPDVSKSDEVIIVGAGPAGMFAALKLIELGLKPIIIERGKPIETRIKDIALVSRKHQVDPDSNYCFGEGGAGTYSDGKLYTRSGKRGDMRRILEIFYAHGASEDILIDNHPHIGTNRLPRIVKSLRESILNAGGQIHFHTRVCDFIIHNGALIGVVDQYQNRIEGKSVLLATGHSARDIFELITQYQIPIEPKEFALGVRIEHPQLIIDQQQYHSESRGQFLPAAFYTLTTQTYRKGKAKGCYSFCMCPGGLIVPAATANGEVVVNGMSNSYRSSKYANSGIVVTVSEDDLKPFAKAGVLAGVAYQRAVEQAAAQPSGGKQSAPAQRLTDFLNRKTSQTLPKSSYQPGMVAADLWEILPRDIAVRLAKGFKDFGKKIRQYVSDEAVLLATESRTSSPIKIPRDPVTCQHPTLKGFYPCGEGAGYAGGIVSAAMDGERCAEAIANALKGNVNMTKL